MKILIISVGKKHEKWLEQAIEHYQDRVSRSISISWLLISPSQLSADQARNHESVEIIKRLSNDDFVWLLDERGEIVDNFMLDQKLNNVKNTSLKRLVIIIGGAYGVNDELRSRADWLWSLSRLVFPHQLVRLILLEQIYRTLEIERGSGYHHQ